MFLLFNMGAFDQSYCNEGENLVIGKEAWGSEHLVVFIKLLPAFRLFPNPVFVLTSFSSEEIVS